MGYSIVNKLVHGDKVVGVTITLGGDYTCSVSVEKAKELGVEDIDIIQYMDYTNVDVIPIGTNKYALPEHKTSFFEDFADVPSDYFGDRRIYYGYLFEDRFIVPLDSESAINRMVLEKKGIYRDV
jgi:hypothetical protein